GYPRRPVGKHSEKIIRREDLHRLLGLVAEDSVAILGTGEIGDRVDRARLEPNAQHRDAVRPDSAARLSPAKYRLVVDLVAVADRIIKQHGSVSRHPRD